MCDSSNRSRLYLFIRAHNESLRKWKEHENVTKALRKQLIDSVEPAYIAHLEDPFSGYNKVPVKDLLLDLFENYGKIRSTDLMANNKRMEEDWDPSETFQTIMARIKLCREFAIDAGQPYTDDQILAKVHAIVFNTGLYYEALEKWDEVPVAQATYDNFCKHMIQAQTRLQSKSTTKQQGYGLATAELHELTENFCNLVNAERAEKENERSTINQLRQEMTAMRTLIECKIKTRHYRATGNADSSLIKEGIVGHTAMPSPRTTTVRIVERKVLGTKKKRRERTRWVAVNVESPNSDNSGRSLQATALTL
jgi:hypothetical protein